MIDDTPSARLMAVVLFSGFIFACAPIAYYLADVERFPIEHTRINTLQPISSQYHVTVTVHAHACPSPSDITGWNSDATFTTLTEILSSKSTTKHPNHNQMLPTLNPLQIINQLDASSPTRAHEMNIVIVAHPKHEIIGPLHLGPTRRSVIFVPCNGYQQRIAQELVARATQLHVVLNADRTKDTDVVSVPHYHISMSLLDASPIGRLTPVTWSGSNIKQSLQPFFDRLKDIVSIDLDTQIVRFVKISEKVHQSCGKTCTVQEKSTQPANFVTPKDLQRIRSLLSDGFTLESSSISPLISPLHLIVYVPPHSETPLYIVPSHDVGRSITNEYESIETNVNATATVAKNTKEIHLTNDINRLGFYVPRYGGVVVWNIPTIEQGCDAKSTSSCAPNEQALDTISDLWVSQLRHLLGVSSTSLSTKKIQYIRSNTGISDWELDTLARGRLSYFATRTTKSLAALSALVVDMSHMAVPVLVGENVVQSLKEYKIAEMKVSNGNIVQALKHISNAFNYARLAEMDPSMAPLRYFPPKHLAAVYLPLIIPLLIPMLMGLKKGYVEWKELKK